MRILIALLLFTSMSARSVECLTYSRKITLQGILSRHTFPEQPNYESIAQGDAESTYFFISPNKPICVAEGLNSDGLEPEEQHVKIIQLILTQKEAYEALRPYLGKEVVCSGDFFHAITGHHHSRVLLNKAKCILPNPSIKRDALKLAPYVEWQDYQTK
jgi:hypothetical protein